jgi:hypothetical protein
MRKQFAVIGFWEITTIYGGALIALVSIAKHGGPDLFVVSFGILAIISVVVWPYYRLNVWAKTNHYDLIRMGTAGYTLRARYGFSTCKPFYSVTLRTEDGGNIEALLAFSLLDPKLKKAVLFELVKDGESVNTGIQDRIAFFCIIIALFAAAFYALF